MTKENRLAFVLLGGSTLKHWVSEHYLRALNRKEVHIYDSDVPKYGESVAAVNQRGDSSWAALTSKHEIECYLHADAIREAFDVDVVVADHPDGQGKAVPKLFAEAYFARQKPMPRCRIRKQNNASRRKHSRR